MRVMKMRMRPHSCTTRGGDQASADRGGVEGKGVRSSVGRQHQPGQQGNTQGARAGGVRPCQMQHPQHTHPVHACVHACVCVCVCVRACTRACVRIASNPQLRLFAGGAHAGQGAGGRPLQGPAGPATWTAGAAGCCTSAACTAWPPWRWGSGTEACPWPSAAGGSGAQG